MITVAMASWQTRQPIPLLVRHRLCLVLSLPSWLRHCLCFVFSLPLWLRHCLFLALPPPFCPRLMPPFAVLQVEARLARTIWRPSCAKSTRRRCMPREVRPPLHFCCLSTVFLLPFSPPFGMPRLPQEVCIGPRCACAVHRSFSIVPAYLQPLFITGAATEAGGGGREHAAGSEQPDEAAGKSGSSTGKITAFGSPSGRSTAVRRHRMTAFHESLHVAGSAGSSSGTPHKAQVCARFQAAFPWPFRDSTFDLLTALHLTFSLPFLGLPLSSLDLLTAFPWAPATFPDLPLPFHCLSLALHCRRVQPAVSQHLMLGSMCRRQ